MCQMTRNKHKQGVVFWATSSTDFLQNDICGYEEFISEIKKFQQGRFYFMVKKYNLRFDGVTIMKMS